VIDPRELRKAFGSFLTGVTVIATRDADGTPRGFTANSFTSVSLDPPLLLVCVAKSAASSGVFVSAGHFSVNILSEAQQDISTLFASKRPDKFQVAAWKPGVTGSPLIENACATFDCRTTQVVEAGDHHVLIGLVTSYELNELKPLGYAQGGYFRLDLERQAASALREHARTVLGAILACDGGILLMHDERTGTYGLPEVGRSGAPGTTTGLRAMLRERGVTARLDFVFAVFEDPGVPVQRIYFRGTAERGEGQGLESFAAAGIPWERIPDASAVTMIQRYLKERDVGAFGIYAGEGGNGKLHALA
jgi:flavin reductase (DIM6/NTAB) family NADH-FMN oxidoreductase RutF